MEQNQAEWALEQEKLERTVAVARAQWEAVAGQSREREKAIQAVQEEMLERVTYDMGGLYSAQGFLDLLELSQAAQPLAEAAAAQGMDDQAMRSLARMMETPYFARIDFRFDGQAKAKPIYIGRGTLMEKGNLTIHVYDWRTPIASVFYRYGAGPARYDAPAGPVTGEVTLKRQYEIRQGKLQYYFDADVQVMDSFLRELLSRSASTVMKSIVETIQRDQDLVIRDMESDVLMVQGAAGSGKTSVALHRVAYLMYQGLAEKRLLANDILILSPNAVFEKYISHVLPELGEKQVETALFDEIFRRLLPGLRVQKRAAWAEEWLGCEDAAKKAAMGRARALKGSRAFVTMLDRLVEELPRRWIPFADVDYDGVRVAWAGRARTEVCNWKRRSPLAVRLGWLENSVWERVHALRPARMEKLVEFARRFPQHGLEVPEYARMLSIQESGKLRAVLRAFTRVDCGKIYCAMFESPEAFARLGRGLAPPKELEAVRQYSLEALSGNTLPYEDGAALAYLKEKVEGRGPYAHMRQVVLDEAQDADALHMALLGLLFPKARFTILGDVHQTITGRADAGLYEETRDILGKPRSTLVRLDKSFRCTREIWDFSSRFLPEGEAGECFSRSGQPPRVHGCESPEEADEGLVQTARECQSQGHTSVALVCKTEAHAREVHRRLKDRLELKLMLGDSGMDPVGVFALPLYVAKGLEFDAVLVCDVDKAHYHGAEDKNLLYVACTRALHRLELFCAGERSPLLAEGGREHGGAD